MTQCAGIRIAGNAVIACSNIKSDMVEQYERHIRQEIIREIQAFANDYHHHVEGRDVVIVEQLLAFLTPVEGKVEDGLGTTG